MLLHTTTAWWDKPNERYITRGYKMDNLLNHGCLHNWEVSFYTVSDSMHKIQQRMEKYWIKIWQTNKNAYQHVTQLCSEYLNNTHSD